MSSGCRASRRRRILVPGVRTRSSTWVRPFSTTVPLIRTRSFGRSLSLSPVMLGALLCPGPAQSCQDGVVDIDQGLHVVFPPEHTACELAEQLRFDAAWRLGVKPDGEVAVCGLGGDIHAFLRRWRMGSALIREESLRPDEIGAATVRRWRSALLAGQARGPPRGGPPAGGLTGKGGGGPRGGGGGRE